MPSTVIASFFYHTTTETLTITFLSGNRYAYKKVPWIIYERLKSAASKGHYFNQYIKNSYEFEHISSEKN